MKWLKGRRRPLTTTTADRGFVWDGASWVAVGGIEPGWSLATGETEGADRPDRDDPRLRVEALRNLPSDSLQYVDVRRGSTASPHTSSGRAATTRSPVSA